MKLNKIVMLAWTVGIVLGFAACADKATGTDATPEATAMATATPAQSEKAPDPTTEASSKVPVPVYKDGTYETVTEKDYESYYAKGKLVVKDGKITEFEYSLYDSRNGDVLFDEQYEAFMPSENYKQQCRDDLVGMKTYGPKLIETQSVDEVDCVSKATWTWKWFKQVANELLEQAIVK